MLTGVDTGFFFELEKKNPIAINIWNNRDIVTSVIVLYELQKNLLQQRFEGWRTVIEDIKKAVSIIPLSMEMSLKAGRIAYNTGMPGLDALILSTLIERGCEEIYTTDSHFELYHGKGVKIINMQ